MTQATGNEQRHKPLIVALACAFALMLAVSLYQRFSNPDLIIKNIPQLQAAGAAKEASSQDAGNMGAIGKLMQEVARNPQNMDALLRLVESLMSLGQWESAENFAQKALALDSGQNPRALYLLALIHHNRGEHEQAAELLEKLLEKTENPSARYSLGILYIHYLHNPEKGLEQLRTGIASDEASQALKEAMSEELEKALKAGAASQRSRTRPESAIIQDNNENLPFPGQAN